MAKFSYVSTGLSSGIGSFTKIFLDENHPEMFHIMLCRNSARIPKTKNLVVIECELSSLASVQKAVEKVKQLADSGEVPPIKYFLGNAGIMMLDRTTKSADGYEITFHVNAIANYVLVKGLLPILSAQPGARVFITGSNAHYGDKEHTKNMVPPPYWNEENLDAVVLPGANPADKDPNSFKAGNRAYATSKLAVLYLFHRFAELNPDIKFVVYEPGVTPTSGLGRDAPAALKVVVALIANPMMWLGFVLSPRKAGLLLAKNFTDEGLWEKVNNYVYCDIGVIHPSSDESYSKVREDQLWNFLEAL